MNTFLEVVAGIMALVGQWMKAHPKIDNKIAVGVMIGIGILCYAIPHHPPMNMTDFWQWLDEAKLWALAIPGAASTIGTFFPGLKTQQVVILLVLVACVFGASAANADGKLTDPERFSASFQVGYGVNTDGDGTFAPEEKDDFHTVVNPAWNLGTYASAVFPVKYSFGSGDLATDARLSLRVLDAPFQGYAQFGYGWLHDTDGDYGVEEKGEAHVAGSVVFPFAGRWALVAADKFGLKSSQNSLDFRISWLADK